MGVSYQYTSAQQGWNHLDFAEDQLLVLMFLVAYFYEQV